MLRVVLLVVLLGCTSCASMSPTTRNSLEAGGFLLSIGMGAASLVSCDPVGAAVWFGQAGLGAAGALTKVDWSSAAATADPNVITEYIPPHSQAEK